MLTLFQTGLSLGQILVEIDELSITGSHFFVDELYLKLAPHSQLLVVRLNCESAGQPSHDLVPKLKLSP